MHQGIEHIDEGPFVTIRTPLQFGRQRAYMKIIGPISWNKHPLSRFPNTAFKRWNARGHVFGSYLDGHGHFGLSNWEEYSFAYSNAASTIARRLKGKHGRDEQQLLPMCLLYRHYLELSMKFLISSGSKLIGLKVEQIPQGTHSLKQLWDLTEKVLRKIGCPKQLISRAKKMLDDYLYWEESDEATRYPYDVAKKKRTVRFSHRYFNGDAWKDMLEGISFFELAEIMLLKHLHGI